MYVHIYNVSYIVLQEDTTTVSASFEIINEDVQEKQDVDILAQSLTQQPNLSQG